MKFALLSLLILMSSFSITAQDLVKPKPIGGGGAAAGSTAGAIGGATSGAGGGGQALPENMLKCPFNLQMENIAPQALVTQLQNLSAQLINQGGNCKGLGSEIGAIINLINPPTRRGSGQGGREEGGSEGGSMQGGSMQGGSMQGGSMQGGSMQGGSSSGAMMSSNVEGFPKSGGEREGSSCTANPVQCDAAISALLTKMQDNMSCFTSADGGIDTVLGAVLQIGSSFSPIVGQFALGVSTVKSVIKLLKGKSSRKKIDEALGQKLIKEKLNSLTACYANQLLQEVHCKDLYLECPTGGAAKLKDGMCNSNMRFDVESKSLSLNSSKGSDEKSACDEYNTLKGDSTSFVKNPQKEVKLLDCLKSFGNSKFDNFEKEDFEIETPVMADIYACTSFWAAKKKLLKGSDLDDTELNTIRKGCVKGKKTKKGAPINSYTYDMNKYLRLDKTQAIDYAEDNLVEHVLKEASDYHKKHLKKDKLDSVVDVRAAVNQCFYGYGPSLFPLEEDKTIKGKYKVQDELQKKCAKLNTCTVKVSEGKADFTMPKAGESFYNIPSKQSLSAMYIKQPPVTDKGNICYGMAMNNMLDHGLIAQAFENRNVNSETCEEIKASVPDVPWSEDPTSDQ